MEQMKMFFNGDDAYDSDGNTAQKFERKINNWLTKNKVKITRVVQSQGEQGVITISIFYKTK